MAANEVLEDLYEALELNPGNVYIQERMIECWTAAGDGHAARDLAETLVGIDPTNRVAQQCLASGSQDRSPPGPSRPKAARAQPVTAAMPWKPPDIQNPKAAPGGVTYDKGLSREESELVDGYTALLEESSTLAIEVRSVTRLLKTPLPGHEDAVHNLQHIAEGHVGAVVGRDKPESAYEMARRLKVAASPVEQQTLIVEDFEALIQWCTSSKDSRTHPPSADEIRERVVQRKQVLDALLPASSEAYTSAGVAQIERQFLERKYVNSETMLGDRVEDIPRAHFFVSEDNYAWDMEELAECLAVNSGVLRNPLSRAMFTEADVRAILAHPLGARLGRMAQEQGRLRQGVRDETIDRVARLGRALLDDQSADMSAGRLAMDEFLAFVALLPESEQKTIRELKVPAKDSMNGQPFDSTIGQAVLDAKGNLTCFHKSGDFLKQAAEHLRRR